MHTQVLARNFLSITMFLIFSLFPIAVKSVTLLSPDDHVDGQDIIFQWEGASKYSHYLWRLDDENNNRVDATRRIPEHYGCGSGGICTWVFSALPPGNYSFRVRPYENGGAKAWSDPRSFVVRGMSEAGSGETSGNDTSEPPGDENTQNNGDSNDGGSSSQDGTAQSDVLFSPAGTIASAKANLEWRHYHPNATRYRVRVLDQRGKEVFAKKHVVGRFGCGDGVCNWQTTDLQDGPYSWEVRAFEGNKRFDWIDTLDFVVDSSTSASDGESSDTSDNGATDTADAGGTDDSNSDNGDTSSNTGGSGTNDSGTGSNDEGTEGDQNGSTGDGTKTAGGPSFPSIFKPPMPLANLRVEQLKPKGIQSFTGPGNQDLLLVAPNQLVDDVFEVRVNGFRGIYLIGGTFNVKPQGWLTTPNGKKVYGTAKIFQFKTHANASSRPFIYVSKLKFMSSQIKFGDLFQIGGAAGTSAMRNWVDFYGWKIKADAPVGWSRYYGGSFSKNVSHSDVVIKTGGVRNVYIGKADVTAGYQHYFTVPGWTTGRTAYKAPEGIAETHYWSTVSRIKTDSSIGSVPEPTVFFMAIGSGEVAKGQYATHYFHEGSNQGQGNYIVPKSGQNSILTHVHPENGNYAPTDRGTYLEWNQTSFPGGNPFVLGRVYHGGKRTPPTVVRDSEVGFQHRVTNRQELLDEINGGYN